MPVKFDWMEISRVEMSDCTSSRGVGAGVSLRHGPTPRVASSRASASAALIMHLPGAGEAVQLGRLQHEIEQEPERDREHHQGQHGPELLASEFLSGADAELAADDAAGRQDQREHDIERVVEVACSTVTTAVTKMIWKIEVPITILVGMRNR